MVYRPYSEAIAVFHRKLVLTHRSREGLAIAELKVWKVPYRYRGVRRLVTDFWSRVRRKGFET
jgi:hypothetical protein